MITLYGREYGTATQIAAALGPDITVAMVRAWARRGRLTRYRRGTTTWYPLDQAAAVEADVASSGRGRKRLDADGQAA